MVLQFLDAVWMQIKLICGILVAENKIDCHDDLLIF